MNLSPIEGSGRLEAKARLKTGLLGLCHLGMNRVPTPEGDK